MLEINQAILISASTLTHMINRFANKQLSDQSSKTFLELISVRLVDLIIEKMDQTRIVR